MCMKGKAMMSGTRPPRDRLREVWRCNGIEGLSQADGKVPYFIPIFVRQTNALNHNREGSGVHNHRFHSIHPSLSCHDLR